VQLRVIHPDGARHWVQVSGRTTFDETTGSAISSYGTMLDVTGQRLAERRLYELDSQFSTFIEGAPASIATFDCDMRFIEVSRQYAADRGITPADLIGRSLYDVFPHIPERWKAVHVRCLAGASERCDLDVLVRPDGKEEQVCWEMRPWYREDQTVGGLVLVSEVITQRVRAQERLRESEARLAAAVRAGALGIYDYDLVDGATTWDARVRELWGISPTETVTYDTFLSGVHPEDRAGARRALEGAFRADGTGMHASEYSWRPCHMSCAIP
jgi:PAS domain S-box-containing protein